jgi:hypothetical protein
MKLTLGEIAIMYDELNGRIIDQKTGERSKTGLLSQKLSIKIKYILNNQINKQLVDERKAYDESYLDIFREMIAEGKGEEKDGQYLIPEEHTPELRSRLAELNNIEKDIEVPDLDVEELFNIETEDYYPILLEKFLKKEEKKPSDLPEPPKP